MISICRNLTLHRDTDLHVSRLPFFSVFLAVLLCTSQATVAANPKLNRVNNNRWDWTQGWHGVVPGKATEGDVELRLGPGKLIKFANGQKLYEFRKGVTMEINAATLKVETITVTSAACPDSQFPFEKKEAEAKYRYGIYDIIGVITTFSDEPEPHLAKLVFGEVQIVDDTPFIPCRLHR
jgi:hypothetical protein